MRPLTECAALPRPVNVCICTCIGLHVIDVCMDVYVVYIRLHVYICVCVYEYERANVSPNGMRRIASSCTCVCVRIYIYIYNCEYWVLRRYVHVHITYTKAHPTCVHGRNALHNLVRYMFVQICIFVYISFLLPVSACCSTDVYAYTNVRDLHLNKYVCLYECIYICTYICTLLTYTKMRRYII